MSWRREWATFYTCWMCLSHSGSLYYIITLTLLHATQSEQASSYAQTQDAAQRKASKQAYIEASGYAVRPNSIRCVR
jgi:hypothetical protein